MNNALESLEFKSLNLINTNKFPMWLIEDHECPRCNSYIKDYEGIMFLLEQGYCLGCDHMDAEYYAERATYGVELNYGDYGEGL